MWKVGRAPRDLVKRLKDISSKVSASSAAAMDRIATTTRTELDRRSFPAKKINKQDDPSGQARYLNRQRPTKVAIKGGEVATIAIQVNPHWVSARSAAVRNVLTALGLAKGLQRASLIAKGHNWKSPAKRQRLSNRLPDLLAWSKRPEKGQQILRHVVRLRDPRALDALMLEPTLRKVRPVVQTEWNQILSGAFK